MKVLGLFPRAVWKNLTRG